MEGFMEGNEMLQNFAAALKMRLRVCGTAVLHHMHVGGNKSDACGF